MLWERVPRAVRVILSQHCCHGTLDLNCSSTSTELHEVYLGSHRPAYIACAQILSRFVSTPHLAHFQEFDGAF